MMDSNVDDDGKDHPFDIAARMSSVGSPILIPVVPEGRPHSPDIIDVDALDTDDIVYIGSSHPRQRRHVGEEERAVPVTMEVIHVTDSEDDNDVQIVSHNLDRPQPPVRRERIFSPPPPPQMGGVPPVPPIPHRFLPSRQRPPSGLIIPNGDPLPFELDLRPLPPPEQPVPAVSAPSHHVPSMGFGGALLAGVRRMMGPRDPSQRPERHNSWGVSGSFIMRFDPFDFAGREEGELLDGLDEMAFMGAEDNPLGVGRVRNQLEQALKRRDREARIEPDYKPDYTHPDRPLPGFTHDFLPSSPLVTEEVDTPSARQASGSGSRLREVTLVCAACRDPLILGASDVGEGRAKRKLWGLRCGHLLDGKCMEKLMEPAPSASDASGSSMPTGPVEHPPSTSQDTLVPHPDSGSMRSRLRPRRGMAGPPPSTSHRAQTARRDSVAKTRNRKGKGKMKAPAVEAEREWNCPVGGCGHVHLSLLMDGRWTMDEKRGAIPVFV